MSHKDLEPALPMNIVFVSPEMAPLVKVGGLADVISALLMSFTGAENRLTSSCPSTRAWIRRGFRFRTRVCCLYPDGRSNA